jgi:hypothetical protein
MFAKASIFISFRKMGIEYKDDLAYNMGFKKLIDLHSWFEFEVKG